MRVGGSGVGWEMWTSQEDGEELVSYLDIWSTGMALTLVRATRMYLALGSDCRLRQRPSSHPSRPTTSQHTSPCVLRPPMLCSPSAPWMLCSLPQLITYPPDSTHSSPTPHRMPVSDDVTSSCCPAGMPTFPEHSYVICTPRAGVRSIGWLRSYLREVQ